MCKVISLVDCICDESKLDWEISIAAENKSRIAFKRHEYNNRICVYIFASSLDQLQDMKKKALCELKQKISNNLI